MREYRERWMELAAQQPTTRPEEAIETDHRNQRASGAERAQAGIISNGEGKGGI